jgi:hypothetical protein
MSSEEKREEMQAHEAPAAPEGPQANETAAVEKPEAKELGAKKPKRRLRWLWRGLWALLALLVIARFALPYALPSILDSVMADYGLEAHYDELGLSVLGLSVELRDFELRDRSEDRSGELHVGLDYLQADLSALALLTGGIHVKRLEVEGLELHVHRDREGKLVLAERFASAASASGAVEDSQEGSIVSEQSPDTDQETSEEAEAVPPAEIEPIDLRLPIRIDELQVAQMRLRVHDESVQPAIDTWVDAHVRVNDLGHPERAAQLSVLISGDQLVDRFSIEGHLDGKENELLAELQIQLEGFHPHAAASWLAALGIEALAEDLDADLRLQLRTWVSEERPGAARLDLGVQDIRLMADGAEQLALDQVQVTGPELSAQLQHLSKVSLRGLRARATLRPDGALELAGIALQAGEGRTGEGTSAARASQEDPPGEDPPNSSSPSIRLDLVELREGQILLLDKSVQPHAELAFALDEFSLRELATPNPDRNGRGQIQLRARMPGIAESLRLQGSVQAFGPSPGAQLELSLSEMGLQRLEAHLRAAGLQALPGQRELSLQIDAGVDASDPSSPKSHARLHSLELRLGEASLLRLDEIGVAGLHPIPRGTRIDEVFARGFEMPVARSESGELEFLGFRTLPGSATPSVSQEDTPRQGGRSGDAQTAVQPSSPASSRDGEAALPRLELGRLSLEDFQIPLVDRGVTPSYETGLRQLRVELEDLALGGDAAQDAPAKALLDAQLTLGDVARNIRLSGSIETQPGPLALLSKFDLQADPLDLRAIQPYLATQGIEPTMEQGKLALQLHASVQPAESGMDITASLEDLSLREGDAEALLSLERASIQGLRPSASGLDIAEILISGPTIRASRNEDAALDVLGLRILPQPQQPQAAEAGTEKNAAATPARATDPGASKPSTAGLRIARIALEGGRALWSDASVGEENVELSAGFTAAIRKLEIGPEALPTSVELALELPGNLDKLSVRGEASLRPGALSTQLALRGSGLRQGSLAAYLPVGVQNTLTDGRFAADLEARVLEAEEGGQRLEATLSKVSLREAESDEALFAIESARVIAPRLDGEAARFEIQELSLSGTELLVTRHAEGVHELLGLRIDPKSAVQLDAEDAEDADQAPGKSPPGTAAQPKGKSGPGYRLASEQKKLPYFAIQNFSLELARLRLLDLSGEVAAPPLDTRLRIFAPETLTLSAPENESLSPLLLRVEGAAEPLIGKIGAELSTTLRGAQPLIQAQLAIEEIHGKALAEVLPSLARRIDASAIQNGSFTARMETELHLVRRSEFDIDLSRGFGAEILIEDIAFRAKPEGEVLAGVGRVYLLAPRILLNGNSRIDRIEIDNIVGQARQTKEGVEILGMHIQLPEPQPGEATSAKPEAPRPQPQEPQPDSPRAGDPEDKGPHIDIGVISVNGLDFDFVDESTDPVTHLPLQGLAMEIQGISTRALTESRPIRFNVSLTGGDVELPKPHRASSLVMGILSSAANAVTGAGNEVELEQRAFLQEFSAQGQMVLHPHPFGRIRTSIAGLELLALRGMAKKSGVEIGSGVHDSGLRLEFRGEKGLDLSARFTFEDLQMDEPPGGPISSYLKLPAPLNAVIFALKDQNDQIRIPVSVHIAEGNIGAGQISGAIITALGSVFADAIAAVPLRTAGAVTGALGLGNIFGSSERDLEALKQQVDFAPAASAITAKNQPAIIQMAELLQDDEELGIVLVHEFGKADLERAMLLANPGPAQTRALVQRLRLRKAELTRQRESKGAQLRAFVHLGNEQQVQLRVHELQTLDRQLGETETAIDKALALLAPGAARRAPQRALDLARALAKERMEQVRSEILRRIGPNQGERIEIRTPRLGEEQREGGGLVLIAPRVRNVD